MNKIHFVPFFIFIILSFAVIGPTVGGYIYSGGDTVTYAYPAAHFYAEANASDSDVKLNSLYLGGFPMELSPVGDYLDPLTQMLYTAFSDPFAVVHIRIVIGVFLGLACAYLFSIQSGRSARASFIVALGYLMCQPLFYLFASVSHAGAFFVFPALLYLVILMRRSVWWPHIIFGALLIWWAWLSGFIQTVFYSALLAGAYALYLDYLSTEPGWWKRWQATTGFSVIGATGTALAIPFFLATNQLREVSRRVGGFGTGDLDGVQLVDIMHFFLPDYVSVPFLSTTLSAGFYVGAVSILLCIVCLPLLARDRHARFFLVSYGVLLIVLCVPLGIGALIQHLPVFSLFHTMKRVMLPGGFLLAYMGGYAFDAFCARLVGIQSWLVITVCAIGGAALSSALAVNAFFALLPWRDAKWQDAVLGKIFALLGKDTTLLTNYGDHYRSVFVTTLEMTQQQFSLLNWHFSFPLAILLIVSGFIVAYIKNVISHTVFARALVTLVVLNTGIVFAAQYDRFVPRASLVESPKIVSLITYPERETSNRVISFLIGDAQFREVTSKRTLSAEEEVTALRNTLGKNANFFFDIARLDGYEPFWPERAYHFFQEVLGNEVFGAKPGENVEEELQKKKEDFLKYLPLLSTYGVDNIIAGYPLSDGTLTLEGTVDALADFHVYVYRNNDVRPLIENPQKVMQVPTWNDAFFSILTATRAPVIIECNDCGAMKAGAVHIRVSEDTPNTMTLEVESEGGWLYISRLRIPGWKASIDGISVSTYYANYLMTAVYVPRGAESVIMQYGYE